MRLAQQLYEGIDIKENGTVGVISYLRTDSTRISEEADAMARNFTGTVRRRLCGAGRNAEFQQKAQDAHEAIRPTDVARTPAAIKDSLSRDQSASIS